MLAQLRLGEATASHARSAAQRPGRGDRHDYSTGTTTDRHDYRLDRGLAIAILSKNDSFKSGMYNEERLDAT